MPRGSKQSRNGAPQNNLFQNLFRVKNTPEAAGSPTSPADAQGMFPGWEELSTEQQQAILSILAEVDILTEAASTIRDQYEEELRLQQQHAAQGAMLARRDGSGLNRQPVPPVPDIAREKAFEKFALDSHRLGTGLAYLDALLAYLIQRGYDLGYDLFAYLTYRTDMLAEGRIKAAARVLEDTGRQAYTQQYSWAVNTFSQKAMERLHDWNESSRQEHSMWEKLRRLLGEG